LLGASVIELEGVGESRTDALRVKSIASAVKNSTLAVPVELNQTNIETVWNALKDALHPRLQVCVPVSSVQMEYLYHKKPEAVINDIKESIFACKNLCGDVEFVADDATRSDGTFLSGVITTAINAGATTVTVCDSAGTMLPNEFADFIENLINTTPALKEVDLGVNLSDEMFLADACAIAAVEKGATEIKAAAYRQGSASLANVAKILNTRSATMGVTTGISVAQLSRAIQQITVMCETQRKKTSPFDSGVRSDDEGIYLTVHDEADSILKAVTTLGYDLSDEDAPKVVEAFRRIAAKKEQVSIRELDAIVASAAMQVPPTYQLETFVINSGNAISSTAHMKLKKNGQILEGVCIGDGPIDAAFLAIESITGRHYELDDFQLKAVAEGREAMGQTIVRLRSGGKLYSGRGISTDIVCAGINAYLSALNKIVYEEEEI
jgi:2-isopropylmalate synthase